MNSLDELKKLMEEQQEHIQYIQRRLNDLTLMNEEMKLRLKKWSENG